MRVFTCQLAIALICALFISTCFAGPSSTRKRNVQSKQGRHGLSRDIKIEEIGSTVTEKTEVETVAEKNNSTSLMSLLISEKWMTPRFTHQLTDAFNSIGLPATVIAGVGFLVILPIYLAAAGFSWLPLQKISNPPPPQDDPDFANYFYKSPAPAPAPEPYWASAAAPAPSHSTHTIMYHSYPPAPAPAPTTKHYSGSSGGYPAPSPAPHYGTYPAPSPSSNYYQAPAPIQSSGYHYSANSPAPAPAPSMHYGYPDPSPSIQYSYSSSMTADPTPTVNYGYQQPAIVSAPAPTSQYGPPPSAKSAQQPPANSYAIPIDSGKGGVVSKEDVKASSRKERSVRNYVSDDQCVQRLACELGKMTQGFKLPNWMSTVAEMVPWQESNLVEESRKLLSPSVDCSQFQCDSYEIVKTAL